jgi:hypothetical protein
MYDRRASLLLYDGICWYGVVSSEFLWLFLVCRNQIRHDTSGIYGSGLTRGGLTGLNANTLYLSFLEPRINKVQLNELGPLRLS